MDLGGRSAHPGWNAASITAGTLPMRAAAVMSAEQGPLHGQPCLLGDHLDISGISRSSGTCQLILGVVEQALGFIALVLGFQLGLGRIESLHRRRLNADELQDVDIRTAFSPDFDLVDFMLESHVGERTDKNLAIRPAEIAALVRGARILRKLLRQLRKVFARLSSLQMPSAPWL